MQMHLALSHNLTTSAILAPAEGFDALLLYSYIYTDVRLLG